MNPLPLNLEDIIIPDDVSLWPPAIGWWLLLILLLAMVCFIGWAIIRYQKDRRYRRQALSLLQKTYEDWQEHKNSAACCQHLCRILKRTAITAAANRGFTQPIAHLYGQDWLDFLNDHVKQSIFKEDLADIICRQQYQPQPYESNQNETHQYETRHIADIHRFYMGCQHWIKQHKIHIGRDVA